jgi:glycosyltransferase involved in cell wall biosynthesis
MRPRVSFVVPCYKHGHFLVECVNSILQQSFGDFEILIMDDCSPDDTPAIAASIRDPRVVHVRNERNLGHIANYNRGISLARGEFIWLINVDDYLLRPYVLQRYVEALDKTPSASYVFCPSMQVSGSRALRPQGVNGTTDRVFSSEEFLKRLLLENQVSTPSVMVRRSSYDAVGLYETDLPVAGDWFQWCRHAFQGDVLYFAEPMVCYRLHELNMTNFYVENPKRRIDDEVAVRWRVRQMALRLGRSSIASAATDAIADDYARRVAQRLSEQWRYGMTLEEFEASLQLHCPDAADTARIKTRVFSLLGDTFYAKGDPAKAARYYAQAQSHEPFNVTIRAKRTLLGTGRAGQVFRRAAARLTGGRGAVSP